jgi:perosamine synthetase
MIPVQRPYLGDEELAAVREVFESRWLGLGAASLTFEAKLKEFLAVKHVICVNTGTSALHLALTALKLGPSDEVIVPSLTFVASAQAVLAAGARPVFCEVLPETLTLDVEDAARRITPRTRAIMPVHYGGLACAMDEILALARAQNLWVVEDAAHAFGSLYHGRKIGTLGDVTCFSFDPIKNITCGEGGAIATERDEIAEAVLPRRILGMSVTGWHRQREQRVWGYEVLTPGFRYHLSNINAAIGLCQLARLDDFRTRKQGVVARYDAAFADLSGVRLLKHSTETFPFLYVLRILDGRRDALMNHLKNRGIGSAVHYIPNHLQPLFAAQSGRLPVTEQLIQEIVSLPLFWEITDQQVELVVDGVRSFFKQSASCIK